MNRRAVLLLLSCPCWLTPLACSKKTEPGDSQPSSQFEGPADHQEIISRFEPFPENKGKVEVDRWYVIELQGQPGGWAHTRVTRHDTARGPRWVTTTQEGIVLRRGGEKMEVQTEEKHLENARGQLLRLWQSEQEHLGEKVVTQAGKVRSDMITIRGPEVRRVPFEPQALGTLRCHRLLFSEQAPKMGAAKNYRAYEPMRAGYTDNRIVVKTVGAVSIEVEQTTSSLPGVVTRVWLDESYVFTGVETRIGALHLIYRQTDKKPDPDQKGTVPDIDPLMTIPSNVEIENPRDVVLARYRIEGLPRHVDSSWLSGPGLQVLKQPAPGAFLVEVKKLHEPAPSPFPPGVKPPELKKHLASTSLTKLDDPEIQKIARTVTAEAPDAWTAAKRLRRWVSEEIDGSMGMGFASASQVLRKREGDCSEQSVLLATLARAVGIPARCVMGLVYQDGSFFRHMWTEVWVGRWQPLDPAQGTDYISGAWIRLAVHSLQLTDDEKTGAGALLVFGANLKVTVESFETIKR